MTTLTHNIIERKSTHSINDVLSKVLFISKESGKKYKVDFDGDLINMASDRYKVFINSGLTCVKCGIDGKYFVKERHLGDGSYHFNLYGINAQGEEVLITKDHIIPKSKGGKDTIDNYQTMCKVCNETKGGGYRLSHTMKDILTTKLLQCISNGDTIDPIPEIATNILNGYTMQPPKVVITILDSILPKK